MSLNKLFKGVALLLTLSGATLAFFLKDYLLIGLLIGAGLIAFGLSYLKQKPKENFNLSDFINVFTHFRVALDSDANVYNALASSLDFTSGSMHLALEKLVNNLHNDHSVTPFIIFAKKFKHRFVTHIMINVYMLINHGLDTRRLWQFNYLFEALVKEYNDAEIALHESSYERFNLSLFLGTGIMMFTIMGSILSMFGGF